MGISVLVVEDDAFTRTMLVTALKQAGLSVEFDTGSAAEAAKVAKTLRPRVGVLDLHLGDGPTGIDVAHALRRNDPTVGIVFLTSFSDPRLLHSNLPALPGNAQYLTKESVVEINVLLRALNDSLKTGAVRSKFQVPSAVAGLTDSQIETLRLVAEGHSNAEIAKRRFVTEKAVEVTIGRIAKGLGLSMDSTRNQRVHMAKAYFRALGVAIGNQE